MSFVSSPPGGGRAGAYTCRGLAGLRELRRERGAPVEQRAASGSGNLSVFGTDLSPGVRCRKPTSRLPSWRTRCAVVRRRVSGAPDRRRGCRPDARHPTLPRGQAMMEFLTIIEPFRIKSVEAVKFTRREEREAALR